MYKCIFLVVVFGVVVMFVFVGCVGGSDNGFVDGEGQEFIVWIMKGINLDVIVFYDKVLDVFEKEIGVMVIIEEIQWVDVYDCFVIFIVGGMIFDVVEIGMIWIVEFVDVGVFELFDEYVDVEDGFCDDFVEGLEVVGIYDGELYGMLWYVGVCLFVYCVDVFEEFGFEVFKIWDDIVVVGEVIKVVKFDMFFFLVFGDVEFQVYFWVWGVGGEIVMKDGDIWISEFDSVELQVGIEFYIGFVIEYDFFFVGVIIWKEIDFCDVFMQGNVVMMFFGLWMLKLFIEVNFDFEGKIGVVVIFGQDGGIVLFVFGGLYLLVFNMIKNVDFVWKFVEFMIIGEFVEQWLDEIGYFFGVQFVMEEVFVFIDLLVVLFVEQMVDGGVFVLVILNFGVVQVKKMINFMIQVIFSGQKDVVIVMKDVIVEMIELFNQK